MKVNRAPTPVSTTSTAPPPAPASSSTADYKDLLNKDGSRNMKLKENREMLLESGKNKDGSDDKR